MVELAGYCIQDLLQLQSLQGSEISMPTCHRQVDGWMDGDYIYLTLYI